MVSRVKLRESAESVRFVLAIIEEAVQVIDGVEEEYEQEPSKRWRANYDLMRGRLLANSVRYAEYFNMCQAIFTKGLSPGCNLLEIKTMTRLHTGGDATKRAAEAERLLKRCMEANPRTPWAELARLELELPMGIEAMQTQARLGSGPAPAGSIGGGRAQ